MARRVILLVRHGETDWNRDGRWQGHTDVPLNAIGRVQARAVGVALKRMRMACIVSSDLCRAYETATIVAERLGIPVAYADADLRERSFGCFEGLTREECETRHPEAWRAWLAERLAPEGAETAPTVLARCLAAIDRVAAKIAAGEGAALVVTHGGVLRAVVSTVTEMPGPIANGEMWRLEWDGRVLAAEPLAPLSFHRPSC